MVFGHQRRSLVESGRGGVGFDSGGSSLTDIWSGGRAVTDGMFV
jgi:hypothetical protein